MRQALAYALAAFLAAGPTSPSAAASWSIDIVDAAGRPLPAMVSLRDADGTPAPPKTPFVVDRARRVSFYSDGQIRLESTAEQLRIVARRGPDYAVLERTLSWAPRHRLVMDRLFDREAAGYASGDLHAHGGRLRDLPLQRRAADLDFVNAAPLVEAEPLPQALPRAASARLRPPEALHWLHGAEWHLRRFGHLLVASAAAPRKTRPSQGPPSPLHAGLHQFQSDAGDDTGSFAACTHLLPVGRARLSARDMLGPLRAHPNAFLAPDGVSQCPVHIASGEVHGVQVLGAELDVERIRLLWERMLGAGFEASLVAGSDARLDQQRSTGLGAARSYVRVAGHGRDRSADERRGDFVAGLRAGRGFVTNGPLLFLEVADARPGDTLSFPGEAPRTLTARARVVSAHPWRRLVLRHDKRDVAVFEPSGPRGEEQVFEAEIRVERSSWIYAVVEGPHDRGRMDAGTPRLVAPPPALRAITNAIHVRLGEQPALDVTSLDYWLLWIDDSLLMLRERGDEAAMPPYLAARELLLSRRAAAREVIGDPP